MEDPPHALALLMDSETLEVYRVPSESIVYDSLTPFEISYEVWEELAEGGMLTVDQVMERRIDTTEPADESNFVVLKLRPPVHSSSACSSSYAYASRFVVKNDRVVEQTIDLPQFGSEFLLLWPQFRACAIYKSACESDDGSSELSPFQYEPSISYTSSTGALMLRPTDVLDTTHVPFEKLHPVHRAMIAMTKPVFAMYAPCDSNSSWLSGVQEQIQKREMAHRHEKTSAPLQCTIDGRKTAMTMMFGQHTSNNVPFVPLHRRRDPAHPDANMLKKLCKNAQMTENREIHTYMKRRVWHNLPEDLVVRVFSVALTQAMGDANTTVASETMRSISLVCKGANALTYGLVGKELKWIDQMRHAYTSSTYVHQSALALHHRLSAINMAARDIGRHEIAHAPDCGDGQHWVVTADRELYSWRDYIRRRYAVQRRKSVKHPADGGKVPETTSVHNKSNSTLVTLNECWIDLTKRLEQPPAQEVCDPGKMLLERACSG